MRVLIVEPHGDDAFISCSSALMREDLDVVVMTLSDRSSNDLVNHYNSVSMTLWLDVPDIHYDLRLKYKTHELHKKYLAGEDLYSQYIEDMDDLLLCKEFDSYSKFLRGIHDQEIKIPRDFDIVLSPLGLFHPNHYATRRLCDQMYKDTPILYYVDKPYIEKRYVQEILKCSTYELFTAPVQSKEIRAELFKKLYPTEQGLLRYSHQTILEWKDIYAVGVEYQDNPVVVKFINKVSDMKEGDKYERLSLMDIEV